MLILVRHGRTEANASGLLLGRLDPALDPVGEGQAEALGRALALDPRVEVAAIVTSPLLRTRQTAAAVVEATGAPVEVDDRWIELDYGELDGRPLADVPLALWSEWRADTGFAPPGGESLAGLGRRVRTAAAELVARAADEDVVVVSHVSPIKAAVAWALDVDDAVAWRLFLAPASISRVSVGPRGPSLHSFNEIAHLTSPT